MGKLGNWFQNGKLFEGFGKNYHLERVPLLFKISFVISGTSMTCLLSLRGGLFLGAIGVACSFVMLCVLVFKLDFLEEVFYNTNKLQFLIAGVFSLFAGHQFAVEFYDKSSRLIEKISSLINVPQQYQSVIGRSIASFGGALALLAICTFLYAFINRFSCICKDWIKETDNIEKSYLVIGGSFFALMVIVVFGVTNVFYGANIDGKIIDFNVVYTTDSANQVATNVYLNINAAENDIRQPLFGLFAMPFALCAITASKVLFFVPNIYPITMSIIQIILLFSCFVLLLLREY